MERLTKRGHKFNLTNVMEGLNGYIEVDEILNRLAQYEDLEEQGLLVVLPCKVGTRVWVIGQNCDLCRDMYAEEPCLFGSCEYKEVFESVFGYGMIDNFGKTVFLTRAEAEAALKEQTHEPLTRGQTERICYVCRERCGDRDDHKCLDCQDNWTHKTFYFDDTKETVENPNYKEVDPNE